MRPVVLHPGFPKSGTTTLQDRLFVAHPDLVRLGDARRGGLELELCQALCCPEGFEDGRSPESIVEGLLADVGSATMVLSNEGLAYPDIMAIAARRLHRIFPDARVLLTIREQVAAVSSLYASHHSVLTRVPAPYPGRPVSFAHWLDFQWGLASERALDLFDYHRTVGFYIELFGRDRVHVLLHEDLRRRPEVFAAELAAVLGIDPGPVAAALEQPPLNPRRTTLEERYFRLERRLDLNRLGLGHRLPAWSRRLFWRVLARGGRREVSLPAGWDERLRAKYAPGNRALERQLGLDLAGAGYAVATPDPG